VKVSTTDVCDSRADVRVADSVFRDFGGVTAFGGPIATLKVFEDNAMVRCVLEEPGNGRVLVVDGGGSMRCALLGGNLATLAVDNDWRGILVNGCIRDTVEMQASALGVKALAAHPRRSVRGLHTGHRDLPVHFAGVTFESGQWLYADADGIVLLNGAFQSC